MLLVLASPVKTRLKQIDETKREKSEKTNNGEQHLRRLYRVRRWIVDLQMHGGREIETCKVCRYEIMVERAKSRGDDNIIAGTTLVVRKKPQSGKRSYSHSG